MADIADSYHNLKHLKDRKEGEENGYLATKGYPKDFQTVDFPKLAGKDGKVTTLAHYQAFFFVDRKDPKKPNDKDNQKPDSRKLKELFANIYSNNTNFTMKMDADALRMDSDAFAKKLGDAGDDAPQVKAQIVIIKDFINSGGIRKTVKDVIREKNPKADNAQLEVLTDKFLKNNFKLEGVITKEPLTSAVWQAEAKSPDGKNNGHLEGRQNYYTGKKWDGSWQIGSQPELDKLAGNGHKGAKQIIDDVKAMHKMKTIDLTNGIKKTDKHGNLAIPPDALGTLPTFTIAAGSEVKQRSL